MFVYPRDYLLFIRSFNAMYKSRFFRYDCVALLKYAPFLYSSSNNNKTVLNWLRTHVSLSSMRGVPLWYDDDYDDDTMKLIKYYLYLYMCLYDSRKALKFPLFYARNQICICYLNRRIYAKKLLLSLIYGLYEEDAVLAHVNKWDL